MTGDSAQGFWSKKWVRRLGLVLLVLLSFALGSRMGGGGSPTHDQHAGEEQESTVWTCSMHPQIKMPKPGQCPICFMDLIPLQTGGAGDDSEAPRLTMSENARILAGIATVPAVRRGASTAIRMVGKIALDETRVEMIAARVAGRIDRLYVDYTGVPVKRGDHLARIYSPTLLSLQKELIEAARAVSALGAGASDMVRRSTERTLEAAKEKLRLLGFSTRELERILARGTTADHMTIRASQRGVVLRKMVEEGSYVKEGTPLFHIADLRKLWVKLDAYESDLQWLRLGQKVNFTVEAFPGQPFDGTISFIDPVVDPRRRTTKVRVITGNPDGRLKPDMLVHAEVKVNVAKSGGVKSTALRGKWISPMHPQVVKDKPGTCDVCGMPLVRAEELGYVTSGFEDIDPLLIPATAPLLTGERAVVYVEVEGTEEPTYEGRQVVLGPRVGDSYVVRSGVAEGEQVVVNGAFKIDGELQIRAKPSMMSPEGGATGGHAGHALGSGGSSDGDRLASLQIPDISSKPASREFLRDIGMVSDAYFAAANALSGDDHKTARTALAQMQTAIKAVQNQRGEQYNAWQAASKVLLDELQHVMHMSSIDDTRALFEKVSAQMIALEKHYGHESQGDRYLAFCPMAFGNKGAYWLQASKGIANPYFGSKMLKCGEIKETFKAKG